MVTGILLAAGRGDRFGANKLMARVAGQPLIRYALKGCLGSRLAEVVVIVGGGGSAVAGEARRVFDDPERLRIVVNGTPERGMMSSLKAGIRSLDADCPAAMVLLADMPLVGAEVIDRLIEAFEGSEEIIVPECAGGIHHPKILPAWIFPEFLDLEDDAKGTVVLDRHRDRVVGVPWEDPETFLDVDSPADLAAVSRRLRSRRD